MEKSTSIKYFEIIEQCKVVFLRKTEDYGASWSIMRLPSLTDQIFIKANRIRTIQESGVNIIGDSIADEYHGIINYCIMAMMKTKEDIDYNNFENITFNYKKIVEETHDLMVRKNEDYGEVWQNMRETSFTDLILTKLLRIKQIEENKGVTTISEGVYSNYQDILNYSIFAIIKDRQNNIKK